MKKSLLFRKSLSEKSIKMNTISSLYPDPIRGQNKQKILFCHGRFNQPNFQITLLAPDNLIIIY